MGDRPSPRPKEATVAAKTMTARESIEAAFAAGSEKRLKAAQIIERVEANSRSAITKGTIRTQLQVQSTKGVWIKRVAPRTFELRDVAAPSEDDREAKPPRRQRKPEEAVDA
jgi:hypothetical protein